MQEEKKTGPIDYPLTPSLLSELDAFENTPLVKGDFNPLNNYTHYYRLWTSYGYYVRNRDDGYLKISRNASDSGGGFTLEVEQVYVNLANSREKTPLQHKTKAVVECRNNEIGSPDKWELTNEFLEGPEDIMEFERAKPLTERVTLDKNELIVKANGKTSRRKVSEYLTGDWNLFDAVQRLPFDKCIDIRFDLLEGLRLFRENQNLYYKGKLQEKWNSQHVTLYSFEQTGNGILPYKYYLDQNHRLVLVITCNRAYILKEA